MKWVRFYEIDTDEDFYVVPRLYCKTGFFTGRSILNGQLIVVMPWRKVRSTRPFGKVVCTVGINNVAFGCCAPQAGEHLRPLNVLLPRPPQTVTPGGDRTPEAAGGNELTPSS